MWKLTLDYCRQDFQTFSFTTFQYDYEYQVGVICMMLRASPPTVVKCNAHIISNDEV
jgi:hypothetical protein